MSGWGIGDLAVLVQRNGCGGHRGQARHGLEVGRVYRVSGIRPGPFSKNHPAGHCTAPCGLLLAEVADDYLGFCSLSFRKAKLDGQSGEIHDWELLLDQLSKPKVEAIKTAADWLEQAGPIAAELNEESKRD